MSKKASNARRVPLNILKKYANFIDCEKCGTETQAKRIVIIAGKTKKGWSCNECSSVTFKKAVTKEV